MEPASKKWEDALEHEPWKVLLVDSDPKLAEDMASALVDFTFDCRKVELLYAANALQAKALLKAHRDMAVLFFDIGLEQDPLQIELAKYVRESLRNRFVRLMLTTDQADSVIDTKSMEAQDINGIKEKSELASNRAGQMMMSALRAYESIVMLETNRLGLNRILFFSIFMMQKGDVKSFLRQGCQELHQLGLDPFGRLIARVRGFFAVQLANAAAFEIVATEASTPGPLSLSTIELIRRCVNSGEFYRREGMYLFPFRTKIASYVMVVEVEGGLDPVRLDLTSMYFSVICAAISNLELHDEVRMVNTSLEAKVAEQTQLLQENNAKLTDLFEEKKNLLRILYHDLSNTLSVMMLAADLARNMTEEEYDYESGQMLWTKVSKSLDIQKEIIEQVRDLDAIRSGKFLLSSKKITVASVVDKAMFVFKDRLAAKGLDLVIENAECLEHIYIEVEPSSFSNSVFNNLLSNALKFSFPNGKIVISANVLASGDKVAISVKDFGIGIPEQLLPHIFREDYKTNRPGTSGERGTGFGMPIVKTYVEAYKGTITVASQSKDQFPDDHWTVFHLIVPGSAG